MIIKGKDVNMVPNYKSNGGHRFVVTEKNNVYPLIRPAAVTSIRITLIDTGGRILSSYNIDALSGRSLTYCAPYIPGYYLAEGPSLNTIDNVEADGSSEMVFMYAKVITEVTITAKEENENGKIIGVFKVENPKVGMHRYEVPDLQANNYIAYTAAVIICWDGINTADGEVYYTKR